MGKIWQRSYDNEAYEYKDPPVYENDQEDELTKSKSSISKKRLALIIAVGVSILVVIVVIVAVIITVVTDQKITKCHQPEKKVRSVILSESRYDVGDVVIYACESRGKVLGGDTHRTCLPNATWTGQPLQCGEPCGEDIYTTGGNAEGAKCEFPFLYRNETYQSCIPPAHSTSATWCSTTSNYDRDERWGNCLLEALNTDPKQFCTFPFIYEQFEFSDCTTYKSSSGARWCGLESKVNTSSGSSWAYCKGNDECQPSSGADNKKCAPVYTTDGNGDGAPCVFPFMYRGTEYSTCIPGIYNHTWCSTTAHYEEDGLWGNCIIGTTHGEICHFPFIYGDKIFSDCTNAGAIEGDLWCGVDSEVDDEDWGYCHTSEECPVTLGTSGVPL